MNTKIQYKFESVRCSPDFTTNSKLFVYNKHLAKLQHVETLHDISALTNNSELNEHKYTIVTGVQD